MSLFRGKRPVLRTLFVLIAVMFLVAGVSAQALAVSPKYVFLFIGDGMALPQLNAAEMYLHARENDVPGHKKLNITQMAYQGLTTTYAADSFITDSAAAGTALSSGYKTNSGVIAMDPSKTKPYETVAEIAKKSGMKVGIVSSVSIDHATPACFYAHEPSRKNYHEIGMQLAVSDFDYFAGGGLKKPVSPDGKTDAYKVAEENSFTVTRTREDFLALKPGVGKVFAVSPELDADKALNYAIDGQTLTLGEFTRKGIELLDGPQGFFMMIEGGKIDWSCHANDAVTTIKDTLAFDEAVAAGLEFAARHPEETLVVVTGDHETGGLTIGFAGTEYSTYLDYLGGQTMSFIAFDKVLDEYRKNTSLGDARLEDLKEEIEKAFGLVILGDDERKRLDLLAANGDTKAEERLYFSLTEEELREVEKAFVRSMNKEEEKAGDKETYLIYGGYEPLTVTLTHTLNNKAGFAWTTYAHTGVPVPTFAQGVGADQFTGYYDNTDIGKMLISAVGARALTASR